MLTPDNHFDFSEIPGKRAKFLWVLTLSAIASILCFVLASHVNAQSSDIKVSCTRANTTQLSDGTCRCADGYYPWKVTNDYSCRQKKTYCSTGTVEEDISINENFYRETCTCKEGWSGFQWEHREQFRIGKCTVFEDEIFVEPKCTADNMFERSDGSCDCDRGYLLNTIEKNYPKCDPKPLNCGRGTTREQGLDWQKDSCECLQHFQKVTVRETEIALIGTCPFTVPPVLESDELACGSGTTGGFAPCECEDRSREPVLVGKTYICEEESDDSFEQERSIKRENFRKKIRQGKRNTGRKRQRRLSTRQGNVTR